MKNNLPDPPSDNEPIARVIFSGRHIRNSDNKVKSDAFMPRKKELDLSVYRVCGLSLKEIWDLITEYIEKPRKDRKEAKAVAEINISDVRKHKDLKLNPDGKPHFRHMNIENFPAYKSLAKMIAVEMSKAAKVYTKN